MFCISRWEMTARLIPFNDTAPHLLKDKIMSGEAKNASVLPQGPGQPHQGILAFCVNRLLHVQ